MSPLTRNYLIFFSVGLLMLVGIILFSLLHVQDPALWDYGNDRSVTCPVLGGKLPISYHNHLKGPYRIAAVKAFKTLAQKIYPHIYKETKPQDALLHLKEAPPSFYLKGRLCEMIQPGQRTKTTIAFNTNKRVRGVLVQATIYICTRKIDRALELTKTPIVRDIKRVGRYGVVLHELGHPLFGKKHPTSNCGAFCDHFRSTSLGSYPKAIMQRAVKVCLGIRE